MKKYIFYILALAFVTNCESVNKNKKYISILRLPTFKILLADSLTCLSSESITCGNKLIFIYFSPTCEHCQKEMQAIIANRKKLNKVKIFMVTNDPFSDLKTFYEKYHLQNEPNIFAGKDYEYSFYKQFLPSAVPYIAIYNGNKYLIKVYKEETSVNSLITSIQQKL